MKDFFNKNRKEIGVVFFVFFSLFFIQMTEYGYSFYLREKVSQTAPNQWKDYLLNGHCTPLVPWWCDVYKYIGRVNQVKIYGVPRDPYIKENGSPSFWLLDSGLFYVISVLTYPFSRLETGWAFASSITFSFWFFLLYLFYRKIFWKDSFGVKEWLTFIFAALLPICFGRAFETLLIDLVTLKFNLGRDLSHTISFGFFPRELLSPFPTPLLTSLFLFLFLGILIYYLGKMSLRWGMDLFLGVLCGFLLLIHIPEWLFGMGTVGILWFLSFFIFKEDRRLFKSLSRIFAVSILISLAILGPKICMSPPADFLNRVIDNPSYHFSYNFYLIFGLWSVYRATKNTYNAPLKFFWLVTGCGTITGFAFIAFKFLFSLNMNTPAVMTRILYPLTSIMFSVLFLEIAWRKEYLKTVASYLVPVVLAVSFFNVKSVAEKYFMFFGFPQTWEDSAQWLNRNTKMEDKILVLSPLLHRYLAGFTHLKFQVAEGHPTLSSTPLNENLRRVAVLISTLGIEPDYFAKEYYRAPANNVDLIYSHFATGDFSLLNYYHKGWDFFLTNSVDSDGSILREILSLTQVAKPLDEPYYVWVNRSDVPHIRIQPDWKNVYQNRDVTIYYRN